MNQSACIDHSLFCKNFIFAASCKQDLLFACVSTFCNYIATAVKQSSHNLAVSIFLQLFHCYY